MKTVLITAIAGDIAQGIASIIRETYPDWRLLGMDIHARHGGELFVDKLFQAPKASDPSYDDWLRDIIDKEKIDICIPMSEAELLHLSDRQQQEFIGVKFITANQKAIEVGSDKLTTSDYLHSIGCERPWTKPAEEFGVGTPLPCIFKPRRSAGSKAVFICNTSVDVEFYRNNYPPAVLQELLLPADKEVTCAIFRSQDGRTAVLQLLRTLVGGFTGWAQVIEDPDITAQCTRLAESLDLKGAINVQLRLTDKGPRIFEINPRFSSTVFMRHRMGFQDVVWSLQDALGENVVYGYPEVGTTAVRVQGAALCTQQIEGASR
jgi:carbamoyl-phosphate synthase large subunit